MAEPAVDTQPSERRLVAILAADIAGYSRIMGIDEAATVRQLKGHQTVVLPTIGNFGGRIIDTAGDGILAQFPSAVRAVECAVAIQRIMAERNRETPEDRRMVFRIGVNLGDVIQDGERIYGEGVNVAARLETLCEPGGVCISRAARDQVRDKLALTFSDFGEHRLKNIARPVHAYSVSPESAEQARSPFRGLDVFEFDHAELFFGRAQAIATCSRRLEQQAVNGKAFLLIYGMSGSGKSSLLRAGLLPAITRPGTVAGIALWRRCLFRPSEGSDAISAMAAALLRGGALPELAEERTATELADLLRNVPDRALALIRSALGKAAAAAGLAPPQARLALAVDQIEELFTTESEPKSREALVRLLAMLAGSGLVWVIGTIRADFFHRCSEVPGFSTLKDELGTYELLPPAGVEIAQIIRGPASAAGLRFEESADHGRLEDVLQAAAVADSGSLPLLEFVLDALYEAGRDRRLLTFAAYRALGGLEGAVARRADEVVDALPPHIQAALPAVLRALTTVRLGEEVVTAAPALLADVAGAPEQSALFDALIAARLLVGDENAEGHAIVRVAHEALLSRWPRACAIVNANRDFLEMRSRLRTEARRWHSDDRNPELLLPPGKRLAEGEELILSRREEVDDQIIEYVEASSSAWKAEAERERQAERARIEGEAAAATRLARRTRHAAIVAIILAAIAGAGAAIGFRGQQEAERQAVLAKTSERQAKAAELQALGSREGALAARDQALRNQSLSLSFLSLQIAASGDTEAAILLALEALPADASASKGRYLFEAESALYKALLLHRQTRIFRHDAGVADAAFSSTGDRIVTSSYDKTAGIWSALDGSLIALLKGHQDVVERATFSPDGSRVVTAARDGTARVWNATTGEQLFVLPQPGDFPTAIFSPNGLRVLTAGKGNDTAIWDALTGKKLLSVPGKVSSQVSFSPDGKSFVAGSGYDGIVGTWNAEDGKPISRWAMPAWPNEVAISPDGGRILISGVVHEGMPPRLWDVSNGTEIAVLRGHKSDTRGNGFSHDGHLIATVSLDGTARLWDGVTGKLLNVLGEESAGLLLTDTPALRDQETNSAFSHDDRLLATCSIDGTVRIWDVEHASLLTAINGRGPLVEHVEFSSAGNDLLTASHDGTARLWDIDGILTTTLVHKYAPTFAVFSPDNAHLVTGGGEGVAHLWDVASGHEIGQLKTNERIQSVAFSPDGNHIATASLDGRIIIWDIESRRQTVQLKSRDAALLNVQFSPDGRVLSSASLHGTSQLWDTESGSQLAAFKTSGKMPKAIFSPDGRLVLTATDDNVARLSKLDGTELAVFVGHLNRVTTGAFSRDGLLFATGSLDRTARIWSTKNASAVVTLRGHSDALTDVDFSSDGQSLLTASRDGTARIWDARDGTEKVVLRGHHGSVDSAAFSPNGVYVVTASSQDRTVRLWEAESGREMAILASREDQANRSALTRASFNSDGTRIAIVAGQMNVQIVRTFETPKDMIDYAKSTLRRVLTQCERKHFFLPVDRSAADCAD
ncbi:hypothetical protein GCM10007874_73060 [Labrys miyagiensis]|uniref:Guanylate cyclase domain-containing protein n=2 Tax=Labrys miyagiensis TaxID=346912 RepID=A0ABQ6D031_9HYPH|nr:hypothetical protein GCM10007874_73060 [Labrys miyagiensis]